MSRITALWTAGAVAVIFSLLLGAVLLRPVLSVDAGVPQTTTQSNVESGTADGRVPVYLDDSGFDDDDDYWDHQEDEEDENHDEQEAHDDD